MAAGANSAGGGYLLQLADEANRSDTSSSEEGKAMSEYSYNVPEESGSDDSSEEEDSDVSSESADVVVQIDSRLLKAAASGDSATMQAMAAQDPSVLLGTTPQGNNCLHVSAIHGHEGFCTDVVALNGSLLAVMNSSKETPLIAAVRSGHESLAGVLLGRCRDLGLDEEILARDKNGCNALHHAIRCGHKDLALQLIAAQPALSRAVNRYKESPMFVAVMRGFTDVFRMLLEIPTSSHVGPYGFNALHAAVRTGNTVIVEELMEMRPALARQEDTAKNTPMHLAIICEKTDVIRVLLQHDCSLGYVVTKPFFSPLLNLAAARGYVGLSREILAHCPDAPYCDSTNWTCLHVAVCNGQEEFVRFILESPHLSKAIINMRDKNGKTALHLAVQRCDPKIVGALLLHRGFIDFTLCDNRGYPAAWELIQANCDRTTFNWNEVSMLMLEADPENTNLIYNHHKQAKGRSIDPSRKDAEALTQTYRSNTSLVAIVIVTITFVAALTLPGRYNNDVANEGLPIMASEVAFQAFFISDMLAMCSSLTVAFICIVARWEDVRFLLHYKSITKKLMWFAYIATTMAFATGLYTVLAPRFQWLAIGVFVLSVTLPIITKLIGEWPALKLRYQLGKSFDFDLLGMM